MTGMRHRLERPTRLILDLALAGLLALLWTSSEATLWLYLAYVCVALSAFLRPGGVATIVRASVVAAVGGGAMLRLHAQGHLPADDLFEVPLLTSFAYLFAGFAVIRTRAERGNVHERLRLERQIDALPIATAAFDGDARVVTWNRAAEKLFGWEAAEIVGRKNPIVPPSDRPGSVELHRRILAGDVLRGVEVERRARDGRMLELSVFSAPLDDETGPSGGFLVLYDNITERKRAERERDDAELRYRSLVEAMPLVTYIDHVDDDATNVYTSPQVEAMLGWPLQMWTDDPHMFQHLLHPDDKERVMALVAAHNDDRSRFEAEYRLRHSDGHYVWVRDLSAIEDADGEAFARGFLLDITEQKRLQSELLQSQKMDALGQFAGGIAHDFNNLLTGIGGYADLGSSAAEPGSLIERCLAGIKNASAEAASLTSHLLAFSRRHVPERQLVDVNETVRGAVELVGRLLRADIAVVLELAENLPPVAADLAQLRQVVLNLALNGRDAMPAGGTLSFETKARAGSVILLVRDTGTGMDSETKVRALEPFFSTKPEGEGTGLGLSVVYGVVDSLGGTIAIESEQDAGTIVEVVLPAAKPGTPHSPRADAPELGEGGPERVLVVEDRDVVRELACDVLEASGFDVSAAASGLEALELAQGSARFDLLLSDVVMPGMSGPLLATELRAGQPELRVLFMSGYTDDVLSAEELAQPGTAFLRKPFGNADLVAAARELLDREPAVSLA